MINKLCKLLAMISVVSIVMVLNNGGGNIQGQEKESGHLKGDPKIGKNIFVETVLLLEQSNTTIVFTVRNNSEADVKSMRLGTSWNSIIIINPKGEVLRQKEFADTDESKIPIIKPGKTMAWKEADLFSHWPWGDYEEFFEEAGLYRLYWEGFLTSELTTARHERLIFNSTTFFFKENKTENVIRNENYKKVTSETMKNIKENGLEKLLFVEEKDMVLLKIAHIFNKLPTSLECILENNTQEEIHTTPICENNSRIVIVTPDGKEQECYVSKKYEKPPVVLKSSEKTSWELDITQLGKNYGVSFDEPGTYKVYWKLINDKGEAKEEIKSEHVLFLKEKQGDSSKDKSGKDDKPEQKPDKK